MRVVAISIRDLPHTLLFLAPAAITAVNVCTWFEVRCSLVDTIAVWGREYAELLFVSACEELRSVMLADTEFRPEIPATSDCLNNFAQAADALMTHLLADGGREYTLAVVGVVRLPDFEMEFPHKGAAQLLYTLLSRRLRAVTDAIDTDKQP